MPILLPLATVLAAALTAKTLGSTAKKLEKRKQRKLRHGI